MQIIVLTLVVLFFPAIAEAHVPVLITQSSLHDATNINDAEISHAYYSELSGNPHTYVVDKSEPFTLYVRILVPDISEAKNVVSALILKELPGGRVVEVATLKAADAAWISTFEFFSGERYRNGPMFEQVLEPGRYRIEINTPDNVEKYVLVVGSEEKSTIGYFETVRRLAGIKEFFGKSQFAVVESPFVYLPLVLLVFIAGTAWWFFRKAGV